MLYAFRFPALVCFLHAAVGSEVSWKQKRKPETVFGLIDIHVW